MSRFFIHECNIDRLEKKVLPIQNKCKKLGCNFSYQKVGEEFREVSDGDRTWMARFVEVEVSGKAIINDWRFVASVEHTEHGNVISQCDFDLEVPAKYRTTPSVCEHCNTVRPRKATYLVHNDNTGEWKQVGGSCLKQFTSGLSAEMVASILDGMDEVQNEEDKGAYGYYRAEFNYYPIRTVLAYATECVNKFGYVKSSEFRSTATRTMDYYYLEVENWCISSEVRFNYKQEMESVGFYAMTDANKQLVEDQIAWILSQDTSDNLYLNNLQVICKSDYAKYKNIPTLVSLVITYKRHLQDVKKATEAEAKRSAEAAVSNHVGNVKDRITIDVASADIITSWRTMYGYSAMYKFVDESGNVFIWITGNPVETDKKMRITGTVKEHDEYRGVKQTVLTRCKVEYIQVEEEHEVSRFDDSFLDLLDDEAN